MGIADIERARSLARLTRHVRRGSPRLLMLAIVTAAGAGAFLLSAGLLRAGMTAMAIRYAVAVLFGYGLLVLLLWLWLAWQRRAVRRRAERSDPSWIDAIDAPVDALGRASAPEPSWSGAGGRFHGGGATVHLDGPAPAVTGGDAASSFSLDLDADGLPLVAAAVLVAVALGAACAAGWIVYAAPELFAELLLDGVVSGAVYRRLRRDTGRPWWRGVLRATLAPALVTLLVFGVGGLAVEKLLPGADSVGDVWRAVVSSSAGGIGADRD